MSTKSITIPDKPPIIVNGITYLLLCLKSFLSWYVSVINIVDSVVLSNSSNSSFASKYLYFSIKLLPISKLLAWKSSSIFSGVIYSYAVTFLTYPPFLFSLHGPSSKTVAT